MTISTDISTIAGAQRPRSAPAGQIDPKLREAAQQFEALMMRQVFSGLAPAGLPGDDGKGVAGEFYQGMFHEHLCEAASSTGGIGLAAVLLRAWSSGAPGVQATAPGAVAALEPRGERGRLRVASEAGDQIRAVAPGRVESIEEGAVEIEHPGGWRSRQVGLASARVQPGQWVEARQPVGQAAGPLVVEVARGEASAGHELWRARRGGSGPVKGFEGA